MRIRLVLALFSLVAATSVTAQSSLQAQADAADALAIAICHANHRSLKYQLGKIPPRRRR